MKVECIRDHPKQRGGVRIPEQLVEYVYGRTRREILPREAPKKQRKQVKNFRLNAGDKAEFERATRKGYLSLSKQQKQETSPVVRVHREWCKSKDKPQIILHKSTGQSTVDQVVIDLATMTLDKILANSLLFETQILEAASHAGMDFCKTNKESAADGMGEDNLDDEPCLLPGPFDEFDGVARISDLSSIRFGGNRSNAKCMASQLAVTWDIPIVDDVVISGESERRSSQDKRKKKRGLADHRPRRRGGGHRQAW